jgi:hypothetical protein
MASSLASTVRSTMHISCIAATFSRCLLSVPAARSGATWRQCTLNGATSAQRWPTAAFMLWEATTGSGDWPLPSDTVRRPISGLSWSRCCNVAVMRAPIHFTVCAIHTSLITQPFADCCTLPLLSCGYRLVIGIEFSFRRSGSVRFPSLLQMRPDCLSVLSFRGHNEQDSRQLTDVLLTLLPSLSLNSYAICFLLSYLRVL